MKVFCVSSYDEIKQVVSEKCSYYAENEILYRGTSKSLVASIVEKCSYNSYSDLVAKEHLLLCDFNKYSHIKYEFNEYVAKDWEIRIAAREHGLASSLMDWSNSLDRGLEFAIHNFDAKKINYTNLWILNKSEFDQISINKQVEKKFGEIFLPTVVQFPKYNESTYLRRKFIQGGYFLKQPYQYITTSLENNPIFSDHLVHVIIPKNAVGGIWKQIASKVNLDLDACPNFGNSDQTLDNICDEINNNYS